VDPALIEELSAAVHGGLTPDRTLLLDLPVALGLARARGRAGAGTDRFEAETAAFFERVRTGYLELARREPRRFEVIDAAAPLAAVETRVAQVLEGLR
jgi:dTMP kinase